MISFLVYMGDFQKNQKKENKLIFFSYRLVLKFVALLRNWSELNEVSIHNRISLCHAGNKLSSFHHW